MKPYALAAGAAVSILLAACGSSNTTTSPTTAAPAAPTTTAAASGIVIANFQFTGALTVKPGDKVSVTNKDQQHHTVTDKGKKFDSGEIAAGGSGSFTAPTTPGTYNLICKYHPRMAGKLVVKS
jgi:plastocyanin